jgi:hypothetical protein
MGPNGAAAGHLEIPPEAQCLVAKLVAFSGT